MLLPVILLSRLLWGDEMGPLDEESFRMKLELDERKRGFMLEGGGGIKGAGAPMALAMQQDTQGAQRFAATVSAAHGSSTGVALKDGAGAGASGGGDAVEDVTAKPLKDDHHSTLKLPSVHSR